jgi:hypothetical protein
MLSLITCTGRSCIQSPLIGNPSYPVLLYLRAAPLFMVFFTATNFLGASKKYTQIAKAAM